MNEPKPKPPIPINPHTVNIIGAYIKRNKEDDIKSDFQKAMEAAGMKPPPVKR